MHEDQSVDFLQKKYDVPNERQVRGKVSRATKVVGGMLAVLALGGVLFSYKIAQITHGQPGDITGLSVLSSLSNSIARLVGSGDKPLAGEAEDRINFLLLGVGGEGHDGAQLSDTVMFGSFKPSTHETGLVSIPRDLVVNIPGHGLAKINAANAYGEKQGNNKGLDLAAQVVSEVMGEEIQYVIRIDFSGFEKLIDKLGGVTICVDRAFTDNSYPQYEGGPVMTIEFTQGCQNMDGERALQYARSRKGNNGEGGDYARAARQQKVLLAVKQKALNAGVLLNPTKLAGILDTLSSHIDTNVSFWEMLRFAQYIPEIDANKIATEVTDVAGGYILPADDPVLGSVAQPVKDDWSDFHELADNLFAMAPANVEAPTQGGAADTLAVATVATIEVQNGTSVSGLAYQTAQRLDGSQFEVVHIGNANAKNLTKTVIYDLTDGRKANELAELQKFLNAEVVTTAEGWIYADDVVPTSLTAEKKPAEEMVTSPTAVDFLIIVGQDAASFALR